MGKLMRIFLVGGLGHEFLWLSIQLGIIIPTDELIFFRGVGIPPTSFCWCNYSVAMGICCALVNISSTCPKCKPRPWNFIWQVWIHLTIPSMYFQIGEFRWFIWKHGSATKPNIIKCRSTKHLGKHQEILTKVRSPHRLSMWHNEGCGERCQPSGGPGKMSANYLRGGFRRDQIIFKYCIRNFNETTVATWPSKIIQFPECSWARDVWF